ncbi:MAG: serine/threonine protein kinase [Planctomycetota bacterium]|jgi:serine/threonine protein kinase
MAPSDRRKKKIVPPKKGAENAPKKKLPPRDPETETVANTRLVNALESDPGFFKDKLIGTKLGKCEIQKLIGEGKTSVVYQANYQPLKRTVAVKLLQDHMAKVPSVLRVFQREGRAVAALDHENILKIYDVGEDHDKHFLVLELLRGEELLAVIESAEGGRLSPAAALDYTRQAARGLVAAHRKNLIHRDIKPQNLVIEPDGMLKIVDFGLAAEAEGAFAGGRLGTPHYMAPEQCRGEMAVTATDVYALGVTLFHMLVGHPPYSGEKTTEAIIARHLEGERLEPEKLVKGLPGSVCELTRRMTRMDPNRRPTAQDIVETIDKLLKGKGKTAGKARPGGRRGAARRAQAPESSNNAIIGIASIVVVLVAVLFFLMGGDDDEPEKNQQAKQPVKQVEPTKDPEPKKDPVKPRVKPTGDAALDALLKDAKDEERTGNLREALDLYKRIVDKTKADPENAYHKEALAAVREVRKAIRAENKAAGVGKRITLRGTEKAAREFDEQLPEFRKLLGGFQVKTVIDRLEKLRDRMRKDSPERERVESMLEDVSVLNDLIGLVEGRAASLSGPKSKWMSYAPNADPGLIVLGADVRGVEMKDDATGTEKIVPWSQVPPDAAIAFLDGLRNTSSGTDAFRLGYYCHVIGDERSELYFDMAMQADPSLRPDVRRLKEASWLPK